LPIGDWRLPIHELAIGDSRIGDWRLAIDGLMIGDVIADSWIADWTRYRGGRRVPRVSFQSASAARSPIVDQKMPSAIGKRNRESALDNP
jgi:hypothetical protein